MVNGEGVFSNSRRWTSMDISEGIVLQSEPMGSGSKPFIVGVLGSSGNPFLLCPAAIWSFPGVDVMAVPEAGSKGNRFPT